MRIGQGSIGTVIVSGTAAVSLADSLTRLVGTTRDWWLNELRAGRAFSGGGSLGVSAGNFSQIQLLNPAASSVTVIVHRIRANLSLAGNIEVRTFNTALTTLAQNGVNLLAGAAAGAGAIRTSQPAAQDGTLVRTVRGVAGEGAEVVDTWDWELGAGEGIIVTASATAIEIFAAFWWVEF